MWQTLRTLTDARIGLPRTGASLATSALLDFRLAHARARDAVAARLDPDALDAALRELGLQTWQCRSAAPDARAYLLRPDLGRRLDPDDAARLSACRPPADLAFVLADGLSARAVQSHGPALLRVLLPQLAAAGWRLAPTALVRHGRVAIGDEIGQRLAARCVAVLIGERPGLSSPDSMSAYITWGPRVGCTDAQRNCVSNIRPAGLAPVDAAAKILYLLQRMRAEGLSGVALKDDMEPARPPAVSP